MLPKINLNETFCPICNEVILRKDKYCKECREEAEAKLRDIMTWFKGNHGALKVSSAELLSIVSKEIFDKEYEEMLERWERRKVGK